MTLRQPSRERRSRRQTVRAVKCASMPGPQTLRMLPLPHDTSSSVRPACAQSSLSDAQRLLQQQGLDTNAVAGASREASQQAGGIFDQVC